MLVELLKRQGVDAELSLPPDFVDRFQKGDYNGAIYGHGGSVNDPYYTLRLYQTAPSRCPARTWSTSRAGRTRYDKIVDDMFVTDREQDQLIELFHKAMEIWLPDLPDIPLVHSTTASR